MPPVVLAVLLVVANVMGAGMIVPQVVRLHRSRSTAGLSGAWIGVGVAMNAWWTTYAVASQLWGVLPVSVVAAFLYVILACQYTLLVGPVGPRRLAVGVVGMGAAPVPFLVAGGWTTAGVALGVAYSLQFAPAAVAAVRSRRLDGISPTTWSMAWVEAAVWFVYGLTVADAALLIGGAGATVASSVILVRLVQVRRSRRPAPGPAPVGGG